MNAKPLVDISRPIIWLLETVSPWPFNEFHRLEKGSWKGPVYECMSEVILSAGNKNISRWLWWTIAHTHRKCTVTARANRLFLYTLPGLPFVPPYTLHCTEENWQSSTQQHQVAEKEGYKPVPKKIVGKSYCTAVRCHKTKGTRTYNLYKSICEKPFKKYIQLHIPSYIYHRQFSMCYRTTLISAWLGDKSIKGRPSNMCSVVGCEIGRPKIKNKKVKIKKKRESSVVFD